MSRAQHLHPAAMPHPQHARAGAWRQSAIDALVVAGGLIALALAGVVFILLTTPALPVRVPIFTKAAPAPAPAADRFTLGRNL